MSNLQTSSIEMEKFNTIGAITKKNTVRTLTKRQRERDKENVLE